MPLHDADIGQARYLVDDYPESLGVARRLVVRGPQPLLERSALIEGESVHEFGDDLALTRVLDLRSFALHHVLHRDRLHDRDLLSDLIGHHEIGGVSGEGSVAVGHLGCDLRTHAKAADEITGEPLQGDHVPMRTGELPWPIVQTAQPIDRRVEFLRRRRKEVSLMGDGHDLTADTWIREPT